MKKLLLAVTVLLSGLIAFSCSSSDKENYRVTADDIDGVYLGTMKVETSLGGTDGGQVTQKVYISKVSGENDKMKLEIKDFSFGDMALGTITTSAIDVWKDGDKFVFDGTDKISLIVGECDLDLSGAIAANGKMDMNIGVKVAEPYMEIEVVFNGDKLENDLSSEAKLISFDFNSDDVMYTEIQGNKVLFYAVEDLESLVFTPTIEVSEGATVSPASGTAQDFSKAVNYTITSEDGVVASVYTVEQAGDVSMFGFEEWTNMGSDEYYEPVDWATSNTAITLIKFLSVITSGYNYDGGYAVNPDSDSNTGSYAAKIETLDTKGLELNLGILGRYSIPKVTAGTMFLGDFETDSDDNLASTKFGIPYFKKPISVKGYYKYTPGVVFYDNLVENSQAKDALAITAVLFEVEEYNEVLTGHNLTESDKIVAMAQFTNGDIVSEYTPFELELNYGDKIIDLQNKKYKFTIVFSSSAGGTTYSGAPGSTLWIDDVEIINE